MESRENDLHSSDPRSMPSSGAQNQHAGTRGARNTNGQANQQRPEANLWGPDDCFNNTPVIATMYKNVLDDTFPDWYDFDPAQLCPLMEHNGAVTQKKLGIFYDAMNVMRVACLFDEQWYIENPPRWGEKYLASLMANRFYSPKSIRNSVRLLCELKYDLRRRHARNSLREPEPRSDGVPGSGA